MKLYIIYDEIFSIDSKPIKLQVGPLQHFYFAGNTFSVKTQFNSEEQWTKAMKYMLTNLKWGLAWVTSKYNKQE